MKHQEKIILLSIIINCLFPLIQPIYNHSQTTFKMPTRPYGAVVTDYDLDGDNDLIVGCSAISSSDVDSIVIMFNDGWGNFDIQGFEANSGIFVYCEDLTNDGYPDIISRDADSIFCHENDQNGGLGDEHKICHTIGNRRIAGIFDMDTNGYLDIVYYGTQQIRGWGIAYNLDGYSFYDDYKYYSEDNEYVTAGFLNDDELADVFITERSIPEGAYIMFNENENFDKEKISDRHWTYTYILDIDNDFENDPVTSVNSAYYYVDSWLFFFQKNAHDEYVLTDSTDLHGGSWVESIEDFDQDGYPDLSLTISSWVSHPSEDSIFVYRNNQNWGYELHHQHYIGEWFWPSAHSGDLNMDGYPEIIAIGWLNPNADYIQILWNDGTGRFIDTNTVYVHQYENQFTEKKEIKIFPNPASESISVMAETTGIHEVVIFNLQGEMLTRKTMITPSLEIKLNLNHPYLQPGLYICRITLIDSTTIHRKIIINQSK
jgi:hypothetical protein